ncbi:MAG: hypothetical protein AVDCRST_MAG32-2971 [uncultured Nocardioides sp.]|uniref:Uncharacterized protein n=1 Tax=uncultured Nocardioides sp. TaxID=198441 RepID=A0A6J4P564_9ACTN|nr:MAG: hypothetical protein AVDCRST_MAG32-2971 [uncultured Nocardioides sp.]
MRGTWNGEGCQGQDEAADEGRDAAHGTSGLGSALGAMTLRGRPSGVPGTQELPGRRRQGRVS